MESNANETNSKTSKQYSVGDKLKLSLYKLLDMKYDVTDDTILSKLHSYLSDPSEIGYIMSGNRSESLYEEWLHTCLVHWKDGNLKPTIGAFSIRVLSIVCQIEEEFMHLKCGEKNILKEFLEIIPKKFETNPLYPIVYAQLLSSLILHDSGLFYILKNDLWVVALDIYMSNESMYVKKASSEFLVTLSIKVCQKNLKEASDIISKVFKLYENYRQTVIISSCLFLSKNNKFSQILILITSIMEAFLAQKEFNKANEYFIVQPQFYSSLWADLQTPFSKDTLIIIGKLLIVYRFTDLIIKNNKLSDNDLIYFCDDFFLQLLEKFQERQLFREIVFLCELTIKYYKLSGICDNNLSLQENLLVIRLLPFLTVIENQIKAENSSSVPSYLSRFEQFEGSMWHSVKLFSNNYRSCLSSHPDLNQTAITSLITLQSRYEILSLKYGTFLLNVLTNIFQEYFLFQDTFLLTSYDFNERLMEIFLATLTKLMSEVVKVSRYQKEIYACLPNLISFLSTSGQSSKINIQALRLVYFIISSISTDAPDSVIEIVEVIASDLQRVSLKHLYSISWDVRDSAIEVLTSLADLSCKEVSFKKPLVDINIAHDICTVFTVDSEYYVRASAIKCLCKLTTDPEVWSEMDQNTVLTQALHALKSEDEAVVRREIPLLIKQIYTFSNIPDETLTKLLYPTLVTVCVRDLYWEVRSNCLTFWQCVIFKHLEVSEAIIPSSVDETKLYLVKQLARLNAIGCLQVVYKCLKDDFDLDVNKKAAEVLCELLSHLNKFHVFEIGQKTDFLSLISKQCKFSNKTSPMSEYDHEPEVQTPGNNLDSTERNCESNHPNESTGTDMVIDSIVRSKDVKLLADVYKEQESESSRSTDHNIYKQPCEEIVTVNEIVDMLTKLNVKEYIDDRINSYQKSHDNLESLLNDILLPGFNNSENPILDCY